MTGSHHESERSDGWHEQAPSCRTCSTGPPKTKTSAPQPPTAPETPAAAMAPPSHAAARPSSSSSSARAADHGKGLPSRQGAQRNLARHASQWPGVPDAVDRIPRPHPRRSLGPLSGSLQPVALNLLDLKSFGERIPARDPERQTAEVRIRVALPNRFGARGTAEIVPLARSLQGKGSYASERRSGATPLATGRRFDWRDGRDRLEHDSSERVTGYRACGRSASAQENAGPAGNRGRVTSRREDRPMPACRVRLVWSRVKCAARLST